MFFTRLAVAALSFGTLAQVFAAPIATGLEGNTVAVSVPVAEQFFDLILTQATGQVEAVKAQVSDIAANPDGFTTDTIAVAIAKIAPALHPVSVKLDALKTVVDKDAILLIGDSATKTTPAAVASDLVNIFETVHEMLAFLLGLESVDALKATCEEIKTEITHIKTGIEATSVASADSPLLGLLGVVIGDITGLVGL